MKSGRKARDALDSFSLVSVKMIHSFNSRTQGGESQRELVPWQDAVASKIKDIQKQTVAAQ